MKARLTGGLAAAALLGAGLVCPGAAFAADPTGYPHNLNFEPSKIIATADAVYAAGVDEDSGEQSTVYVAEVGGDTVQVAADSYLVDMAVEPDGSTLRVVTSDDDGSHYWDVDTDDMVATEDGAPAAGHNVELLGSDSGGVYEVQNGASFALHVPGLGSLPLAENASSSTSAAIGPDGDRTWYVAGSQFYGESGSTATLWSYDEQSGEHGTPVALGAAGDPDEYPLDIAADPTDGVVYALSFRNNEDAPQSYGLTIVQDGPDAYVPLYSSSDEIELSSDGDTLYVAQNGGILALDTDDLADYTEDSDVRQLWIDTDSSISSLALDTDGHVYAAAGDDVFAFYTPGVPTGLLPTTQPEWTDYAEVSWQAPATTGGVSSDELGYAVRITDRAGGVVEDRTYYGTSMSLYGLSSGHTYDVSVGTDNGLFVSAPVTTSFTVPTAAPATATPAVPHPSAVAVGGTPKLGSTLSVTSTGSWSAGAALAYSWTANGARVSTAPTLKVTPALVGKRIAVSVTGTQAGYVAQTVTSAPSGKVAPGTLSGAKPKVIGKAKVGKKLTAKAGSWTAGTKLAYEWSANGKRIKGADAPKLKLTKALKGKKISVSVTGTKAGYAKATKESAKTGKVRR